MLYIAMALTKKAIAESKSKLLTVRIKPTVLKHLERIQEALNGRSQSEIIEELIEQEFKRLKK